MNNNVSWGWWWKSWELINANFKLIRAYNVQRVLYRCVFIIVYYIEWSNRSGQLLMLIISASETCSLTHNGRNSNNGRVRSSICPKRFLWLRAEAWLFWRTNICNCVVYSCVLYRKIQLCYKLYGMLRNCDSFLRETANSSLFCISKTKTPNLE